MIPLNPGIWFVVLASVFGLTMLMVMPPYMVPDENAHLYRSYQISTGHIFGTTKDGATGGIIPKDFPKDVKVMNDLVYNGGPTAQVPYKRYLTKKMNTSDTAFTRFDTTSVYSPVSYIPQTIGVLLSRLIYPSNLVILYTGRLFNLAAFIGMMYIAIRLIPIGKWAIVIAGLLPMTLHQAASMSSDVMNIGLSFIAVAYCLHLFTRKVPLERPQIIRIALIGVLLGLTKQTNAILIVPFLFLPNSLFPTLKKRVLYSFAILAAAFGAAAVWYGSTKLLHYNFSYSGVATVDMAAQAKHMLTHPLSFLRVLFRTFVYNDTPIPPSPDFYWNSMVGVFSWIRYQLPAINVVFAYTLILFGLLYRADDEKKLPSLTNLPKYAFLLTYLGSVLAIAMILYLIWTPVAAPVIAGIQGRYFIPLLGLLIPVFYSLRTKLVLKRSYYIVACVAGVSLFNFLTMLLLTVHYFNI